MIFRNILGCSLTLAALRGHAWDDLDAFFAKTAKDMTFEAKAHPEKTAKQLQDAKDRYVFVG
jgi:hypothetical protein